jgi:hypothetical protein
MRLNQDIKAKWLLHAKGFLFLILGLFAAGVIFIESQTIRTILLLVITIWAFCRFYYYMFYVLERYAGRDQKYAGILDALKFIIKSKGGLKK